MTQRTLQSRSKAVQLVEHSDEYRRDVTDSEQPTEPMPRPRDELLPIGAVSRACGVPIDTLRTWERRYHFPTALRSDGGQRLFSPEIVERLILIRRAIDAGHRASVVVPMDHLSLVRLLGERSAPGPSEGEPLPPRPVTPPLPSPVAASTPWLERWLQAVAHLDADSLDHGFRHEQGRMGTIRFLTERGGPFLTEVGEAWADGRLTVAHEHFASERFREFLTGIWSSMASQNRGPTIVCATLPGDQHHLGLHMAAAAIALAGARILFLGADTPIGDVASAANQSQAVAIAISVSSAVDPALARRQVLTLQASVAHWRHIVVGGYGAPNDLAGIVAPGGLEGLSRWVSELVQRPIR